MLEGSACSRVQNSGFAGDPEGPCRYIWYILESKYGGTPFGPKCILYAYMGP